MQLSLPDFDRARVLVLGDVMLDRYWHGSTARISPEAPVPVVNVGEEEERPGGAANVALNCAALGAAAELLAVTGEDEAADRLQRQLEQAGIGCRFQRLPGVPTITKLRVLSRHQQLIRLDFEQSLVGHDGASLAEGLHSVLGACGVVVFSDYAKGTLRDAPELIRTCRDGGVPVIVDPKGTDFTRYAGADVVTPNLGEFQAVVGTCRDDAEIVECARNLAAEHGIGAILVTRGEHGMSLVPASGEAVHLPAQAREVFDVTGAGDTVVAVLAAALAAGAELANAAAIANLAAGIVVGKLGTASVMPAELRRALHGQGGGGRGATDEAALQALISDARAHGERIVMTNGCFDLLHAGHVAYLEQARSMGDRLIVAVNDDASVRRLKGLQRPINPLEQRMAVLAGLAAVDWVVPFAEDTPERLICSLEPDVLVKGGDYAADEVAGAECVRRAGGEVRIIDLVDGCSTTGMVERIREHGD